MFDDLTGVVIGSAVALWFAQGWYLNTRLERVHAKLDQLHEQFDGLREYLYETDPQFDDERGLMADFEESLAQDRLSFAGANHMDLTNEKKRRGQRTLNTTFINGRD